MITTDDRVSPRRNWGHCLTLHANHTQRAHTLSAVELRCRQFGRGIPVANEHEAQRWSRWFGRGRRAQSCRHAPSSQGFSHSHGPTLQGRRGIRASHRASHRVQYYVSEQHAARFQRHWAEQPKPLPTYDTPLLAYVETQSKRAGALRGRGALMKDVLASAQHAARSRGAKECTSLHVLAAIVCRRGGVVARWLTAIADACMPSLPTTPIPTSASRIMLTSFPPSPTAAILLP